MKVNCEKRTKKTGFTIVELLTVMSVIILLISLLVPALNEVKRFAKGVKQKAQFHSISVALDLFNAEQEGYPPSSQEDASGNPYCGAMKLAEAMVGKDLRGFNPLSTFSFSDDGKNQNYYTGDTLEGRRSYLNLEGIDAMQIQDLYGEADCIAKGFDPCEVVLCDIYRRPTTATGKKAGMPVLYYRANTSNTGHDPNSSDFAVDNIYNYYDNHILTELNSYNVIELNPLYNNFSLFYRITQNKRVNIDTPRRADSYILMSAGMDGLYGTGDDVFNFEKQ
ncbi:type II secretion system protein [Planctomycetota bacterium]